MFFKKVTASLAPDMLLYLVWIIVAKDVGSVLARFILAITSEGSGRHKADERIREKIMNDFISKVESAAWWEFDYGKVVFKKAKYVLYIVLAPK